MKNQNHHLIENIKEQLINALNDLETQLRDNQVNLKELRLDVLELSVKVHNEDNPFLDKLDFESDNDGNEYYIQL